MILFHRRTLPIGLIILFIFSSSGCAFVSLKNWFEQDGRIVYASNKQPVPNAIVAAVWRGKDNEKKDRGLICYHVETTRTDNDGKFTIPGWREYFEFSKYEEKKISVLVYKPGFWTQQALLQIPSGGKQAEYQIESISDENRQTSSKNRLKYLQKIIGMTSCNITDKERPKLEELYASVLSEAEGVAQSAIDKKIVKSLRNWTSFVTKPASELEMPSVKKRFK